MHYTVQTQVLYAIPEMFLNNSALKTHVVVLLKRSNKKPCLNLSSKLVQMGRCANDEDRLS